MVNDFEQVAADPRLQFLGNVAVGKDVTVPELFKFYNAVVLAYGAASDRTMGVPGENLKNVFSARAFVNWYNGHPEFRWFKPNLECEDVIIIGQGNVAIDCARILTKTTAELAQTDIAQHAVDALSKSKVKRVHVVGRRGHVQAAFTMKELREVTRLDDATAVVKPEELERGRSASSVKEMETHRAKKRMDALLAEVATAAAKGDSKKSKQMVLRFLLSPSKVLPGGSEGAAQGSAADAVGAMEFDVTALEGAPDNQKAVNTGKKELIPAGMVLRSIGYKSIAIPDVPFDDKKAVVRNEKGRVKNADGSVYAGLYTCGWLKRGPTGIIGTNITDARETVGCILEDKNGSKLAGPSEAAGMSGLLALLKSKGKQEDKLVPWSAYKRIDAAEVSAGSSKGKPREKLTDVETMLKVAQA